MNNQLIKINTIELNSLQDLKNFNNEESFININTFDDFIKTIELNFSKTKLYNLKQLYAKAVFEDKHLETNYTNNHWIIFFESLITS